MAYCIGKGVGGLSNLLSHPCLYICGCICIYIYTHSHLMQYWKRIKKLGILFIVKLGSVEFYYLVILLLLGLVFCLGSLF